MVLIINAADKHNFVNIYHKRYHSCVAHMVEVTWIKSIILLRVNELTVNCIQPPE
jgi:hypothetical protein